MKKLNKKGFTLVELLAVIIILGILLIVVVPAATKIQEKANQKAADDQALIVLKGIETCQVAGDSDCLNQSGMANYIQGDITGVKATVADGKWTKFEVELKGYKITVTGDNMTVSKIREAINGATAWNEKTRTLTIS